MKVLLIAVSVSMLFAAQVFAVDAVSPPKGPGPNFEQHRAEILKRIDQRIARNQEEKTCIQAAKNHDDVKVCRDKFKAEAQEQRNKMKK